MREHMTMLVLKNQRSRFIQEETYWALLRKWMEGRSIAKMKRITYLQVGSLAIMVLQY